MKIVNGYLVFGKNEKLKNLLDCVDETIVENKRLVSDIDLLRYALERVQDHKAYNGQVSGLGTKAEQAATIERIQKGIEQKLDMPLTAPPNADNISELV